MKIPVLKRKNNSYIKLPEELRNSDSLELFELRDGFFLVSTNLNPISKETGSKESSEKKTSEITLEDSLAIVSKLLSVKFSERNPQKRRPLMRISQSDMPYPLLLLLLLVSLLQELYPLLIQSFLQ